MCHVITPDLQFFMYPGPEHTRSGPRTLVQCPRSHPFIVDALNEPPAPFSVTRCHFLFFYFFISSPVSCSPALHTFTAPPHSRSMAQTPTFTRLGAQLPMASRLDLLHHHCVTPVPSTQHDTTRTHSTSRTFVRHPQPSVLLRYTKQAPTVVFRHPGHVPRHHHAAPFCQHYRPWPNSSNSRPTHLQP
jgi:hypothetical protein